MDKSFYADDVENCAAALHKEGWKSDDKDELKEEYKLNKKWTDKICEKLKEYERIDKND